MGLLFFSKFSSIPNLFRKIQSRREQKERFTPTFAEWGLLNGEQIIASADGNLGLLFAVPANEILYITSASLSQGDTTTSIGAKATIQIAGKGTILSVASSSTLTFVNSITQTYPMPIRVNGATNVVITGLDSGTSNVTGTIQGFLLSESLEIV